VDGVEVMVVNDRDSLYFEEAGGDDVGEEGEVVDLDEGVDFGGKFVDD